MVSIIISKIPYLKKYFNFNYEFIISKIYVINIFLLIKFDKNDL